MVGMKELTQVLERERGNQSLFFFYHWGGRVLVTGGTTMKSNMTGVKPQAVLAESPQVFPSGGTDTFVQHKTSRDFYPKPHQALSKERIIHAVPLPLTLTLEHPQILDWLSFLQLYWTPPFP